jgi:divalent metal cation (Fe/Co/Zn/Cd) transporter
VHLDPVLPEINNHDQIKGIIKSVLSGEDNILNYKDLRLIGEESYATLVLDIITSKTLTDDNIEEISNKLKNKIRRNTPNIKDVRINMISNSD